MTRHEVFQLLFASGTPDDLAAELAPGLSDRWADYASSPYLLVAHDERAAARIEGEAHPGLGYTIVTMPAR